MVGIFHRMRKRVLTDIWIFPIYLDISTNIRFESGSWEVWVTFLLATLFPYLLNGSGLTLLFQVFKILFTAEKTNHLLFLQQTLHEYFHYIELNISGNINKFIRFHKDHTKPLLILYSLKRCVKNQEIICSTFLVQFLKLEISTQRN